MRQATGTTINGVSGFQSTHSLRSATLLFGYKAIFDAVSIHALLAECDKSEAVQTVGRISFNPRTPCGVRPPQCKNQRRVKVFQSTHSLRSATPRKRCGRFLSPRFNPRTPCGVRPLMSLGSAFIITVSIHALLAECDFAARNKIVLMERFQSTHSLRSATVKKAAELMKVKVSIHALLAECDRLFALHTGGNAGFNPRTPCGVRRYFRKRLTLRKMFQSTHSLRSATAPDLIHCYSTEQIILCANLPKKTVIARLLFLSIYLSIFYSQCITPIADLPGNSCELEVGAQAMFNSL